MEWIRWVWAALALILLIAEVFVSGFVLICFAVGSAAASLVAFMGYGSIPQLLAFIAVSLVMVGLMRPLSVRLTRAGGRNTVGIDRVIGRPATVLIAIDPHQARGRVRIDREEWQAMSEDDTPIPVGEVVEVLGVEGTRVKVRRLRAA